MGHCAEASGAAAMWEWIRPHLMRWRAIPLQGPSGTRFEVRR